LGSLLGWETAAGRAQVRIAGNSATLACAVGVSEERAARNESLFRDVNGEIAKLEARLTRDTSYPIVCECANMSCAQTLEVERDVYWGVRANPLRFFVAPGHEQPEIERIVGRERGYVIVEKFGAAAATAARLD
jgi:hypothetical protein